MRSLLLLAASAAALSSGARLPDMPASLRTKTDSSVDCETCQYIVGVAQSIAENATTLAEVAAVLQQGCTVLDGIPALQSACDWLGKEALSLLPFIDKQLQTLAWDIPLGFCSTFFPVCTQPCCNSSSTPEQIALTLTGSDMSSMAVTWVTLQNTSTSTVQWGPASTGGAMPYTATGAVRTYTQGGWIGVIHSATMVGLQPGTAYSYRVGDASAGWSDVYNFTTFPANIGSTARPLKVIQIGDMAYDTNSDGTVASMTALVDAQQVDMVLHIGDISYADGFMGHWDAFMRKITPISARVPYMTVPGNHELWYNFQAFRSRWTLPLPINATTGAPFTPGDNNTYYSFTIGSAAHIVMFDTETAIDTGDVDAEQVDWLRRDFAAANAQRSTVPWLLAGAHRPLYCTNGGWNGKDKDCKIFGPILQGQVEDLFYQQKVDMVFAAHMHGYERSWPTYKAKPTSTSYSSPSSPVYIVNGAAGNREGNTLPAGDAPWSPGVAPSHTAERGYGLLTLTAGSGAGDNVLNWQFFAANGTLIDAITVTK